MKAFLVGFIFLILAALFLGALVIILPLLAVISVFFQVVLSLILAVLFIWLLGKFVIFVWKNIKLSVFVLLFLNSFILSVKADTIYLKNGNKIEGFIKREEDKVVEFDVGFGTVKLRRDEINSIYRSTPEESERINKKWQLHKEELRRKDEEERLKESTEPRNVDLVHDSGQLIVDAVLNRKIHANLVLDTGAAFTLLSNNIAKQLGLNTEIDPKDTKNVLELVFADGTKIKAKHVVLEAVSVKGVEAERVDAAILLGESKNANFKDGLLGMSYLNRFSFKVDLQNKKLTLERLR